MDHEKESQNKNINCGQDFLRIDIGNKFKRHSAR
jgi:hypothetical protein